MKKYAEIIDKGECISTLSVFTQKSGELANREKWKRLNYYPQNGDVGEIIEKSTEKVYTFINSRLTQVDAYILKVKEGIYVPITQNGIKEIRENEYNLKVQNNDFSGGMNQKQKEINSDYDRNELRLKGIGRASRTYHDAFWSDICQILKNHTCNFTIPMYHSELLHECLMYTFYMCRHIERQAGQISDSRKEDIASEVCDVFLRHFEEFTEKDAEVIINRVATINNFESLSANIDSFYNR